MNLITIVTLLGGLAMFLYGMRQMGDGLKESSSGTLKRILGKVTDTAPKAFLLGLLMTALIQSSTATIVITSGLVGAGVVSLHQSLGIIVGANVGTTVTGQIVRLLDIDAEAGSFLVYLKPSFLAPLALIIGIVLIMKGKDTLGKIIIGFGILFSGLLNMTGAVESLTETGIIERLFGILGENPFIGYLIGAGVAFVLQSSSATISILQAFSLSGMLSFNEIYSVLLGIYLGDCVTTAIVCNIGAKPDAKRVGVVNILFNLCKTALIFVGVTVAHRTGLLGGLWNKTMYSGGIANMNSVFNLVCALLMLPVLPVYERASLRLVKDRDMDEVIPSAASSVKQLEGLNPVFFSTPALAFNACYEALLEMFRMANNNILRAFDQVRAYDKEQAGEIRRDENVVDAIADKLSNYLVQLSSHITGDKNVEIEDQYYTVLSEFERLSDHAVNIVEEAENASLSADALAELDVLKDLISKVLEVTGKAFKECSFESARKIEPLEEVVDDMVVAMRQRHLERLKKGTCSIVSGTEFLNMLSDIERISDICSNVGTAIIVRIHPEMKHEIHEYISKLHAGNDENFNREYKEAYKYYFGELERAVSA